MRWAAKVSVQWACSALPRKAGDAVYHRIQDRHGLAPNPGGQIDFLDRVEKEVPLAGASVVELGSGWYPLTPLLLVARGAAEVQTFDLNHHYSSERTSAAARALLDAGEDADFLAEVERSGQLPPEVHYRPESDLRTCTVEKADLAISRYVLEHVQRDVIEDIHRRSTTWLDGPWIHWVSPADHRSYSDRRLTPVDFLRYSEWAWWLIAGNRFAFHNRMRLPEYRDAFATAGMEIEVEDSMFNGRLIEGVKAMKLDRRFAGYTPEELLAGSLWFVLRGADAPVEVETDD